MIGIIGFGMVGKAVEFGFRKCQAIIHDPNYKKSVSIKEMVERKPEAIFVCVPTPNDGSKFSIVRQVLQELKDLNYTGVVAVKSTVLPQYIEEFDIVYNPEFLSRATANTDFVNPPIIIVGGDRNRELLEVYAKYSIVLCENVYVTNVKTAAFIKYTLNSFYATKVTFMNQMHDVATQIGVDWADVRDVLRSHPWVGPQHCQVPGPDGERGFGGPCLPKDTETIAEEYDVELLKTVLEINKKYRG